MSIIYKMDESDEEAIELLFTMLQMKVEQYHLMYEQYAKDESLPQGVEHIEDIMLDSISIGSNMLIIFDRFILYGTSIIECDLVKGDIYVYNLCNYEGDVATVLDKVNGVCDEAAHLSLYNHWDASESLDMLSLLHKVLLEFEEYSDVTVEEVRDMLDWIGYTRIQKELH